MAPRQSSHLPSNVMAHPTSSLDQRTRSEESWVEISRESTSTMLASPGGGGAISNKAIAHHAETTSNKRRRRAVHPDDEYRPATLPDLLRRQASSEDTGSSQEEYEESESESDRVMTSSGEGLSRRSSHNTVPSAPQSSASDSPHIEGDSDDENRTAVNYPIRAETCFTPQPNIFSHPPSSHARHANQSTSGSYFPPMSGSQSHNSNGNTSRNLLAASYKATVHHDEALRASLSTLLSCAAAARNLKDDERRSQLMPTRNNSHRMEPMSLRLVPESALPGTPAAPKAVLQEPVFQPTLRRVASTTTMSSSAADGKDMTKRRSRPSSKERSRATKKARHNASSANDDSISSPTLFAWVVSAGVVVAVLSALSFSAGFSIGKEAGKIEAGVNLTNAAAAAGDDVVKNCAREASRGGLGLKRSLARTAVASAY